MLTYLKVEDFALIESAEVELKPGFNALTGETGAGKTVLVGAIGLLLGERGDSMQVRRGADSARFSCAFDLTGVPDIAQALSAEGYIESGETELLLGRSISPQGRGRCTVNGRLAPVSALAGIGESLVDIHGQNTHQALLKPGTHMDYLDRFAGGQHLERLAGYRSHYERLRALVRERESLAGGGAAGAREAELLVHEVEEIDGVDPQPGEIEVLEQEAGRLRNEKELAALGAEARVALAGDSPPGSAREFLSGAGKLIGKMALHDGELEKLAARSEAAAYEVEDLASSLESYIESLGSDTARLEEVESRLSVLRQLSRKYGGSLDAACAYREEAKAKLGLLDASRARTEEIGCDLRAEQEWIAKTALSLTEGRREAAEELSGAVRRELEELELSGSRFEVSLSPRGSANGEGRPVDTAPGPSGCDSVEFLFSPEPGEQPRPLRRIASGGEMSRVMLAVKIVLAGADRIPVLVFDEVDAGIGGETAVEVGRKLMSLTDHHQVFCVTHIPQIASFADWQYRVFKKRSDGGASRTGIELLDGEERVEEVCRMLGDSSGRKATSEHARDLLERARNGAGPPVI